VAAFLGHPVDTDTRTCTMWSVWLLFSELIDTRNKGADLCYQCYRCTLCQSG